MVTLGEGYHNFHHEFPSDYRNAISWFQYDPTKWCIALWRVGGLAYDLKKFPSNEIEKGRFQQQQKKLDKRRATLDWGTPIKQLPVITWDDFMATAKEGNLVVIAGIVHDVSSFISVRAIFILDLVDIYIANQSIISLGASRRQGTD